MSGAIGVVGAAFTAPPRARVAARTDAARAIRIGMTSNRRSLALARGRAPCSLSAREAARSRGGRRSSSAPPLPSARPGAGGRAPCRRPRGRPGTAPRATRGRPRRPSRLSRAPASRGGARLPAPARTAGRTRSGPDLLRAARARAEERGRLVSQAAEEGRHASGDTGFGQTRAEADDRDPEPAVRRQGSHRPDEARRERGCDSPERLLGLTRVRQDPPRVRGRDGPPHPREGVGRVARREDRGEEHVEVMLGCLNGRLGRGRVRGGGAAEGPDRDDGREARPERRFERPRPRRARRRPGRPRRTTRRARRPAARGPRAEANQAEALPRRRLALPPRRSGCRRRRGPGPGRPDTVTRVPPRAACRTAVGPPPGAARSAPGPERPARRSRGAPSGAGPRRSSAGRPGVPASPLLLEEADEAKQVGDPREEAEGGELRDVLETSVPAPRSARRRAARRGAAASVRLSDGPRAPKAIPGLRRRGRLAAKREELVKEAERPEERVAQLGREPRPGPREPSRGRVRRRSPRRSREARGTPAARPGDAARLSATFAAAHGRGRGAPRPRARTGYPLRARGAPP